MRSTSLLRGGTLALVFAALIGGAGPAFAAPDQSASQFQEATNSSTGPYDGADYEAAKHAFK
jgi:hypothetical protein